MRTRSLKRLLLLGAIVACTASCGDVVRQGKAPVFLVVDLMEAAQGSATDEFFGFLLSDVLTLVTEPEPCSSENPCPTYFNDVGRATFRIVPKDIGTTATPSAPTTNNEVTITRYRVTYRRADGRNTPGVDVPHGFDGAATGTVPLEGQLTLSFELVRNVSKKESPLVELIVNPTIITTIADITFYGQDRVGNEVTATGSIQIDFGNFGDGD
jgi:hypothetical protein